MPAPEATSGRTNPTETEWRNFLANRPKKGPKYPGKLPNPNTIWTAGMDFVYPTMNGAARQGFNILPKHGRQYDRQ